VSSYWFTIGDAFSPEVELRWDKVAPSP
ncbi:uncharacterized protein METZ01_LOCUS448314, partial [marine metagenome]